MNSYKLSDLIEICNGTKYNHLNTGSIPLYGSGGIMSYVDDFLYDGEAVLLPRKGTLNNILYTEGKIWTVDTMYYATTNTLVLPYYLYCYLSLLDLGHLDSGSALPSMTKSAYYNIEVRLPDIPVQSSVVDLVKNIDKKIELNNKINSELEATAKTIYNYWFVQFDFPDENGNPYKSSGGKMVYNEDLKRDIPEGWNVDELQSIATSIMGHSPSGESYNSKAVGMPLLNGPADYKNGALFGKTYTTSPTRVCKKDDMVLCIRATIGNLVYSEGEFCLGRGVAAVRPHKEESSELIYFLLQQEIKRFKIQATGSIIKGIIKDDLVESKCLIPNENIVLEFHKIAKPMFNKQRKAKTENLNLIDLRNWLLPLLMNGQVKIK